MARRKWWFVGGLVVALILIFTPVVVMNVATGSKRYAAGDMSVPQRSVALVFGAGIIMADGKPTPFLQRRLDSAIDLYKAGKVNVLLLSGDNSTIDHNEPFVMGEYAVSQGVHKDDVVMDFAGFSTYDTCYRAKAIFGVTEAILVTQAYHLPRAVWTCDSLGVKSVGVAAKSADDAGGSDHTVNYLLREVVSINKAMVQTLFKPRPIVLGEFEPIDIKRDGEQPSKTSTE